MTSWVAFAIGPTEDPDRYELGEASGLGGESIVYRGSRDGRPVALKILRDDHQHRLDDFAELWLAQVELLRSLHHPGVVRPIEAFVGPRMHRVGHPPLGRSLCLVMDWVDGSDLDDLCRSRRTPLDRSAALWALRPVADALDVMHSGVLTGGEPVVHGDIKPTNIRVTPTGEGVLVDFGLAGALARKPAGGTPSYRAPESLMSGNSQATDMYGLGAVVAFVWNNGSPRSDAPPALPRLLAEALSTDPADRPVAVRPWLDEVMSEGLAEVTPAGSLQQRSRVDGRSLSAAFGGADQRVRWSLLGVVAAVVAWTMALLVGSADGDEPAAVEFVHSRSPSATPCDPEIWSATAEEVFPTPWADPDNDCLHTLVELNNFGSDPFEPTARSVDDLITDLAWQAHMIEAMEIRMAKGFDPIERSTCTPSVWADAALRWSTRDNAREVRWEDPDGDCLTSDYERANGTDPNNPDTDGDGYLDSIDPGETNGLIAHQHAQMRLIVEREESAPVPAIAGRTRSAYDPVSRGDPGAEVHGDDR